MVLLQNYQEKIAPALREEYGLKSPMATPKVKKVVVNMGIGALKESKEEQEKALTELAKITGQKPAVRRSKLSVAGFSVRRGQPVGLAVTLRGKRMYDFLEKLFAIVLPRVRDFRGVPRKSFDTSGNYTLGIPEHTIFPEVDLAKVSKLYGFEITIVTNCNKEQSLRLLEQMGMPFVKEEN
jgi:large subunit ribosomal protein L5